MSELFNRDFAITVGSTKIVAREPSDVSISKPTLRVAFKVEKSLDRNPNKADIQIWNLNENHRKTLQKKQQIIVEAGYVSTMQLLFSGDITFVNHVREGADWVTTIQNGDGSNQFASSQMNVSFAPGAQMEAVLKSAAEAMGVGLGNAMEKFGAGGFRKGITEFTRGIVTSGMTKDVLDRLASTTGFTWSIQDGELQILGPGDTTTEELVSLTKDSGLIGSPEVGEDGVVKAKSLLQGTIRPGRKIRIQSLMMDGFFRVEKVTHSGDTWGSDWYSELEAKPVS